VLIYTVPVAMVWRFLSPDSTGLERAVIVAAVVMTAVIGIGYRAYLRGRAASRVATSRGTTAGAERAR
jgi:hypothetical protein